MSTCILVVGFPRSGTSLVAGTFARCGAWTGVLRRSDKLINPKGFFENLTIRKGIMNNSTSQNLSKFLQKQTPSDRPWMLKSELALRHLERWMKAWPDTLLVVTERDWDSILASHARVWRLRRLQTDYRAMLQKIKPFYKTARKRADLVASIDQVIATEGEILRGIAEKAGLVWNATAVREFVEPGLIHFREGSKP